MVPGGALMMQIIARICFFAWAVGGVTYATIMIISPRLWHRILRWSGRSGNLSEEKYSSGGIAVVIRLSGVCILAVIIWFLYGYLSYWKIR
jgi:hypothetical protein